MNENAERLIKKNRPHPPRRSENSEPPESSRGQISIMIAIMMSTFLFFFAFVINTGMLVNAKINLQNAADLAAYAGAAVQARQLTQIAYLNYEMRRQYKKYLFRVYDLANMAEDSFPKAPPGSGTTPMQYIADASSGVDYQVPTTCIIFNSNDNFCHLVSLPKISIPPPSVLDAVTDTLSTQLQAIEAIRQQNCKANGVTNLMLNFYWLYNTDPNLTQLNLSSLDKQQQNTMNILRGLASGLGIVPRETILRTRIQTLEGYVNAPPQMSLTLPQAGSFLSMPDTAPYERSVQAFYSAYYTLGNHTFSGSTISMDELIPGNSSGALLLGLKNIQQRFDTYAIDFTLGTGLGGGINTGALDSASAPAGADCNAVSVPITIQQPLTLGVYKDPTIMTYYAIRLKATARVLFSPFGDMELKAYAAAQPFGSRIGPTDQNVSFTTQTGPPTNASSGSGSVAGYLPNLTVRESDSTSRGEGWDTQQVVGTLYQALGLGGNNNPVNSSMIQQAYQVAMAPSPWEGRRYTIINDQGPDPFVRNFDTNLSAAFWAPLFPPGSQATNSSTFKQIVNGFFDDNVNGNLGASGDQNANRENIKTALATSLETYVSSTLQQGAGEDGEGINIVRITNPFVKPDGTPISGSDLFMTDAESIKTSWNSVNRADYQAQGRVGYSVKFISFASLTSKKLTTNGSDNWTNAPNIDPEAEQDVPFLKH